MRLVRFDVPTDRLETVDGVLESEGIDHVVTPEYSDEDRVLVEFPLPVQAVDELLDECGGGG